MERMTRFRATLLVLLVCIILGFFSFKLYDEQIIKTGGVIDNTTTFTTMTRVKAARGDILDRNGNLLVSNRASYDLVVNHFVLNSSNKPNEALLRLVNLCKDRGIAIKALSIESARDESGAYVYSAFITLQPTTEIEHREVVHRVEAIDGVLSVVIN